MTAFGMMAGDKMPVQRCNLDLIYRVVNTDNFGSDYPNEKWASEPLTKADAEAESDRLNRCNRHHPRKCDCVNYDSRWHKVVQVSYQLQPGFEP